MDQSNVKDYLNRIRHSGGNLRRTLSLVLRAAPGWSAAWMILLFLQGLLPASTILLVKPLVNSLVAAKNAGGSWESVRPALILILAVAGTLILAEVLRSCGDWVRAAQSELVQDHLSELIHRKAAIVDIAFYDSPDYYDRLHRACTEASTRPIALLESVGGLFQNGITFVVMAGVLLSYGVWLPLALIVGTVPAVFVIFRYNRRYHDWWEQTTEDRRRAQYYDVVLTNSGAAAELRLFDLGGYFRTAYQDLRRQLREERLEILRAQSLARLGASTVGLTTSGLALAWMALRVLSGTVSLGDLALFYQAFNQGQGFLRSLLSNIGQVYNNTLFLTNVFEFLDLRPAVADPPDGGGVPGPGRIGLRLRNVTFRYPGTERPVIRDLSLTIPPGQTVAIVGVNGAGKSTLIKLLCRFYDPDEGSVELDGIDLRDLSVKTLWSRLSVMFQLPWSHYMSAADNIAIGNLAAEPSRAKIALAAERAGAHDFIARLPQGYDTMLGRWFAGGSELSVGQWQRLALARAILRAAPVVILDEPTSFMDSWAEVEWLRRFREAAGDRTTIFITHRFTSALYADVIHVMEDGRIVESGTHAQLVARGGRYAASWAAQMSGAARDETLAPV